MKYIKLLENSRYEIKSDSSTVLPELCIQVTDDEYENLVSGAAIYSGGLVVSAPVPPAPTMAQLISQTTIQIDADVDAIYAALLGNREAEYALAEKEATAYRDAGYTGTVPASVQAWASAKGQTATWAADDILSAAAGWRYAQSAIRANRLALKEAARNAADATALATVQAQWAGFLAVIKPQLGL